MYFHQVLSIARDVEQGLEKKRRVELQHKPMKRQFQQVHRGDPVRSFGVVVAKCFPLYLQRGKLTIKEFEELNYKYS